MFDIIVLGAGPAGSTAATLLAKAGRHVALVEKAEFPRRKVCGEYISAATLPLLDACGVGEAFRQGAGPAVTKVGFYAGQTMVKAPLPVLDGKIGGGGRALGRETLDTLLRDAAVAAGATLFQPAEALAAWRTDTIHTVQLADASLDAPILIAACGSWNIKPPFSLDRPPRDSDMLAFKAHLRAGKLPEGLMPLLAFPGGYGGMVHTDGGRISLSCCIRRDALAAARDRHGGRAADALFTHIRQTTRGADLALDGAEMDGAALAAGPIRPGMRARYTDGIFFTGNLAGEAHPVIAEGISMAVQASSLLARILIAEPDMALAGARYETAWRKSFCATSLCLHPVRPDGNAERPARERGGTGQGMPRPPHRWRAHGRQGRLTARAGPSWPSRAMLNLSRDGGWHAHRHGLGACRRHADRHGGRGPGLRSQDIRHTRYVDVRRDHPRARDHKRQNRNDGLAFGDCFQRRGRKNTARALGLRFTSLPEQVFIFHDDVPCQLFLTHADIQLSAVPFKDFDLLIDPQNSPLATAGSAGYLGTSLLRALDFDIDIAQRKFNLFLPDHVALAKLSIGPRRMWPRYRWRWTTKATSPQ